VQQLSPGQIRPLHPHQRFVFHPFRPFNCPLLTLVVAQKDPATSSRRGKRTAEEAAEDDMQAKKMSKKDMLEALKVEIARSELHTKNLKDLALALT
jgi:hypothetical protein